MPEPRGEVSVPYTELLVYFDSRKLLNVKFSVSSWSKKHSYLRKEENRAVFSTFSMTGWMINHLCT